MDNTENMNCTSDMNGLNDMNDMNDTPDTENTLGASVPGEQPREPAPALNFAPSDNAAPGPSGDSSPLGSQRTYQNAYPQQPYGAYQPYGQYSPYGARQRVVNEVPYRSENPYAGYAQSPYQQSTAQGQEKKTGKKHTGLKAVAIVIAAILLIGAGGAAGAVLSKYFTAAPQQTATSEKDNSGSGKTVRPIPEDKAPVFVPSTGDNLDTFNASQIYKNNVNSIVGINNNGESYNIFGQITSRASSGTGFIIREDGYILTNYHVVSSEGLNNPTLTVTLYNGNVYDAVVVGYDSFSDVALIKIDASGLTPVSLGDSDSAEPGQNIAIIGHPLGQLTYSIAKGIISSTDRSIKVDGVVMDLFQIDAAVNNGNSGGPAFNENGQVIGIVNAKYASSTIEGLGFIIPINNAVKIANDLINYGFVRGQAGFGITVVTVYRSGGYYAQIPFGLRVESVSEGSCAEKAGIRVGDVIIGIDDISVTTQAELNAAKSAYKSGDSAKIRIYRDQTEITLTVVFDEFIPDEFAQNVSPS